MDGQYDIIFIVIYNVIEVILLVEKSINIQFCNLLLLILTFGIYTFNLGFDII